MEACHLRRTVWSFRVLVIEGLDLAKDGEIRGPDEVANENEEYESAESNAEEDKEVVTLIQLRQEVGGPEPHTVSCKGKKPKEG